QIVLVNPSFLVAQAHAQPRPLMADFGQLVATLGFGDDARDLLLLLAQGDRFLLHDDFLRERDADSRQRDADDQRGGESPGWMKLFHFTFPWRREPRPNRLAGDAAGNLRREPAA